MVDVQYYDITYKNIDEVGFYAENADTDDVSLIFFSGKRSSDVMVDEFESFHVQYHPCKVYLSVPRAMALDFVASFPYDGVAGKKYRGRSEE